MAVAGSQGQHLGRDVFGQAMGEAFSLDVDDFGNPGDLCGCSGGGAGVVAGHQHVHFAATLRGGGDGF